MDLPVNQQPALVPAQTLLKKLWAKEAISELSALAQSAADLPTLMLYVLTTCHAIVPPARNGTSAPFP
jgi:hypothetical protein